MIGNKGKMAALVILFVLLGIGIAMFEPIERPYMEWIDED